MSDISDDPPKRKGGELNRFFHGQSWTFSGKKNVEYQGLNKLL